MTSPRIRQLAEGLKQKFLALQKAEQIHTKMKTWEKSVLAMNLDEIKKVSYEIAERVDKQFQEQVDEGLQGSPAAVVKGLIASELEGLSL